MAGRKTKDGRYGSSSFSAYSKRELLYSSHDFWAASKSKQPYTDWLARFFGDMGRTSGTRYKVAEFYGFYGPEYILSYAGLLYATKRMRKSIKSAYFTTLCKVIEEEKDQDISVSQGGLVGSIHIRDVMPVSPIKPKEIIEAYFADTIDVRLEGMTNKQRREHYSMLVEYYTVELHKAKLGLARCSNQHVHEILEQHLVITPDEDVYTIEGRMRPDGRMTIREIADIVREYLPTADDATVAKCLKGIGARRCTFNDPANKSRRKVAYYMSRNPFS